MKGSTFNARQQRLSFFGPSMGQQTCEAAHAPSTCAEACTPFVCAHAGQAFESLLPILACAFTVLQWGCPSARLRFALRRSGRVKFPLGSVPNWNTNDHGVNNAGRNVDLADVALRVRDRLLPSRPVLAPYRTQSTHAARRQLLAYFVCRSCQSLLSCFVTLLPLHTLASWLALRS
eukprot:1995555-Pleurochrysis_carterae.AAC.1